MKNTDFNAFEINKIKELIAIWDILANTDKYINLTNLLKKENKSILNYCLENENDLKKDLINYLESGKSGLFQLYINTNYYDLYDLKCKYLDKIDINLFVNIISIVPLSCMKKKYINKYNKIYEEFKKLDSYSKLIYLAQNKRY